jgi:IS30 family transposase
LAWTEVGRRIGRHRATVAREVARNGGRGGYRAGRAHARAQSLRPCRTALLCRDRDLAANIAAQLKAGYSPAGTAHMLGGVCTETIYQGVYSGALGVKACDVLRSRRHRRRRRRNAADHRAPSHFLGVFAQAQVHGRGWRRSMSAPSSPTGKAI